MAKAKVTRVLYPDQRPKSLEIKIGRKKLTIKYLYAGGDIYGFEVKGSRDLLPSATDIFKIVDAKRLDRIGTIELIELIEEITEVGDIKVIRIIESIESMPPVTIKGSEGVALKQKAAGSGAWVSPDSHSDPDSKWNDETKAYDDNTATYAYPDDNNAFLYLTFSTAIRSNKLRVYTNFGSVTVDIDAKIDGVWTNVYYGTLTPSQWVEKTFTEGDVDEIRIQLIDGSFPADLRLNEADLWQVPTTGGESLVLDETAHGKLDTIKTELDQKLEHSELKHENKTYKTARFDASSSGNIVAAVAGKVIKVHGYEIQAQGTVKVNFNDGSGGAELGMEWDLQAREGAESAFYPAPAYLLKTSVNTALYATLSAAVTVVINIVYSDDDAS